MTEIRLEKELAAFVRDEARRTGWRRFHVGTSTRLVRGRDSGELRSVGDRESGAFPDEILLRPPRLIVAELKMDGKNPTDRQEEWLVLWRELAESIERALRFPLLTRPSVEVYVWRPADRDRILEILA